MNDLEMQVKRETGVTIESLSEWNHPMELFWFKVSGSEVPISVVAPLGGSIKEAVVARIQQCELEVV
jgi:hypothetical protein